MFPSAWSFRLYVPVPALRQGRRTESRRLKTGPQLTPSRCRGAGDKQGPRLQKFLKEKRRYTVMNIRSKAQIWASAVAVGAMLIGGGVIAKTSGTSTKVERPIFAPAVKSAAIAAPLAASYSPLIKEALPEV